MTENYKSFSCTLIGFAEYVYEQGPLMEFLKREGLKVECDRPGERCLGYLRSNLAEIKVNFTELWRAFLLEKYPDEFEDVDITESYLALTFCQLNRIIAEVLR